MNFKTPFKVLTTAALIGTLSLSAIAPGAASAASTTTQSVKAKTADHAVDYLVLVNSKGELAKLSFDNYAALEIKGEAALFEAFGDFTIKYIVTGNGNVYDLNDFAASEIESQGKDVTAVDLLKGLDDKDAELDAKVIEDVKETKIEDGKIVVDETPAVDEDFKVTEIAAITDTIKKEADQQLSFTVNGEAADLDKLKEAGYKVAYEYNKTGADYTTSGKLDGEAVATSFEYRVVVTPKEGEAITTDWTKVTVLDPAVATKVTEVSLSNKLNYVTLDEKDENAATISVTKAENAFGEELKGTTLTAVSDSIESITSSDETVAYADGNKIVPRKAGQVEFTVNFTKESKLEAIKIAVEVKVGQVATSIKADDLKVETDASLDYLKDVKILDQYNEELRGANAVKNLATEYNVVVKNAKDETVTDLPGAFGTAGKYTVTISTSDTDAKELGSYTIETVDVSNEAVGEYKLTPEDKFEIDVNPELTGQDAKNEGTVTLEGFTQGVKVSTLLTKLAADDAAEYELRTSNKDVLVVNNEEKVDAKLLTSDELTLQGKKAGSAKITLVKIEGKKETVLASLEVEVKNSVKLVTEVNFKDKVTAVTVGDTDQSSLKAAVAEATNLKEAQIFKVEYIAANKSVIVTIAPEYAGETTEFKLAATKVTGENEAAQAALETATKAVEKAETSKVQADVDAARKLVTELADVDEKTALQNRLDAVQVTIDAAATEEKAISDAKAAVAALFADDKKEALADGVDAAAIASAQDLVDAVKTTEEKATLQTDVDAAQDLLDAATEEKAISDAKAAVAALFADDKKEALADGVDAAAIASAQDLVDAVKTTEEKATLQTDVDAAQDLLDIATEEKA